MKDEETREEGKKEPAVWERMEGEPGHAYNMFQVYRNLGSTRTVRKAYALERKRNWKTVTKRDIGYWRILCARWHWVDRANEFDRMLLAKAGDRAASTFIAGLLKAAAQTNKALDKVRPKTWQETLDGLEVVASFISVEGVQARLKGNEPMESRGAGECCANNQNRVPCD